MQTVILAVLPILVAAVPQRMVIPHFHHSGPCQSYHVANERWCLVRCVELTPTENHLESCDECKSLEVLYRPDSRHFTKGCSCCGGVPVDCNKLLRGGTSAVPSVKSCCKCSQSEVNTESEQFHQPPMKRAVPKRGRIRAVIVYHPRKRISATVGRVDRIPPDLNDYHMDDDY